jgi:hypothetical protein
VSIHLTRYNNRGRIENPSLSHNPKTLTIDHLESRFIYEVKVAAPIAKHQFNKRFDKIRTLNTPLLIWLSLPIFKRPMIQSMTGFGKYVVQLPTK